MSRKYMTEYAICYSNNYWTSLSVSELMSDGEADEYTARQLERCHIYMIATRPDPYFIKDSFLMKDGLLSVDIGYKVDGVERILKIENFKIDLEEGLTDIRVSPYPHKELGYFDSSGTLVSRITAGYFASFFGSGNGPSDLNSFQVLYVGQAYGDGTRSALQRLKKHETLQKILGRKDHDYPDQEVNVFMFQFENSQIISSMDGAAKQAINDERDTSRLLRAIGNPPGEKQGITMIEAGLIRYLQPRYNKIYKEKFPSSKLKTLESCFDLDISGLIVELRLFDIDYYFYSDRIGPVNEFFAQYDLFDKDNRMSFFNSTELSVGFDVIYKED